jgi:hypothetical protein
MRVTSLRASWSSALSFCSSVASITRTEELDVISVGDAENSSVAGVRGTEPSEELYCSGDERSERRCRRESMTEAPSWSNFAFWDGQIRSAQ